MEDIEKVKRKLIGSVCQLLIKDKKPEDEAWEELQNKSGRDCKALWQRMRTVTLKKLARLSAADDKVADIPPVARMTPTDWLMYDLVLMCEDIDVIDTAKFLKPYYSAPAGFWLLLKLIVRFGPDNLTGIELSRAWVSIAKQYNKDGRECSPLLLQRRWFQLKQLTRDRFNDFWQVYRGQERNLKQHKDCHPPGVIECVIAKSFTNIITQPFPEWSEAIAEKQVLNYEDYRLSLQDGKKKKKKDPNENQPELMIVEKEIVTIDLDCDDAKTDNDVEMTSLQETSEANADSTNNLDKVVAKVDKNVELDKNPEVDSTNAELDVETANAVQCIAVNDERTTDDDISYANVDSTTVDDDDTVQCLDEMPVPNAVEIPDSNADEVEDCLGNIKILDTTHVTVEQQAVDDDDKMSVDDDADVKVIDDEVLDETVLNAKFTKKIDAMKNLFDTAFGIKKYDCDEYIEKKEEEVVKIRKKPGRKRKSVGGSSDETNTDVSCKDNQSKDAIIKVDKSLIIENDEVLCIDDDDEADVIKPVNVQDKSVTENTVLSDNEKIDGKTSDVVKGDDQNDVMCIDKETSEGEKAVNFSDVNDVKTLATCDDLDIEDEEYGEYLDIEDAIAYSANKEELLAEDSEDSKDEAPIDIKLVMNAIVYTTKLDKMNTLLNADYEHVESKTLIKSIVKESKPFCKFAHVDKTVSLTSSFFKKPTKLTYSPIQVCKNPDFNTRLRRLPVAFLTYPMNRQYLKSIKPITIDLSRDFERKLENGTVYLKPEPKTTIFTTSVTNIDNSLSTVAPTVPVIPVPAQSLLDSIDDSNLINIAGDENIDVCDKTDATTDIKVEIHGTEETQDKIEITENIDIKVENHDVQVEINDIQVENKIIKIEDDDTQVENIEIHVENNDESVKNNITSDNIEINHNATSSDIKNEAANETEPNLVLELNAVVDIPMDDIKIEEVVDTVKKTSEDTPPEIEVTPPEIEDTPKHVLQKSMLETFLQTQEEALSSFEKLGSAPREATDTRPKPKCKKPQKAPITPWYMPVRKVVKITKDEFLLTSDTVIKILRHVESSEKLPIEMFYALVVKDELDRQKKANKNKVGKTNETIELAQELDKSNKPKVGRPKKREKKLFGFNDASAKPLSPVTNPDGESAELSSESAEAIKNIPDTMQPSPVPTDQTKQLTIRKKAKKPPAVSASRIKLVSDPIIPMEQDVPIQQPVTSLISIERSPGPRSRILPLQQMLKSFKLQPQSKDDNCKDNDCIVLSDDDGEITKKTPEVVQPSRIVPPFVPNKHIKLIPASTQALEQLRMCITNTNFSIVNVGKDKIILTNAKIPLEILISSGVMPDPEMLQEEKEFIPTKTQVPEGVYFFTRRNGEVSCKIDSEVFDRSKRSILPVIISMVQEEFKMVQDEVTDLTGNDDCQIVSHNIASDLVSLENFMCKEVFFESNDDSNEVQEVTVIPESTDTANKENSEAVTIDLESKEAVDNVGIEAVTEGTEIPDSSETVTDEVQVIEIPEVAKETETENTSNTITNPITEIVQGTAAEENKESIEAVEKSLAEVVESVAQIPENVIETTGNTITESADGSTQTESAESTNKKSILSDLMAMSGISAEDSQGTEMELYTPVISSEQMLYDPMIEQPLVLSEPMNVNNAPMQVVSGPILGEHSQVQNVSNLLVPMLKALVRGRLTQLTPVVSIKILKVAVEQEAMFYCLHLPTGALKIINVSILNQNKIPDPNKTVTSKFEREKIQHFNNMNILKDQIGGRRMTRLAAATPRILKASKPILKEKAPVAPLPSIISERSLLIPPLNKSLDIQSFSIKAKERELPEKKRLTQPKKNIIVRKNLNTEIAKKEKRKQNLTKHFDDSHDSEIEVIEEYLEFSDDSLEARGKRKLSEHDSSDDDEPLAKVAARVKDTEVRLEDLMNEISSSEEDFILGA